MKRVKAKDKAKEGIKEKGSNEFEEGVQEKEEEEKSEY